MSKKKKNNNVPADTAEKLTETAAQSDDDMTVPAEAAEESAAADTPEESTPEAADDAAAESPEDSTPEAADDAAAESPEESAAEIAAEKDEQLSEKEEAKRKKRSIARRKWKYGSVATAVTVVVVALVVLFNVVVNLLSEKIDMSVDLTKNGTFEISQETMDYLATVNEPVEIVCMSDENTFKTSNYVYYKQAYEVLRKYTIYSDNVSLKFVDMVKNPTYADRYKSMYKGEIDAYSIVVSSSKRIRVIAIQDLYNTEMNYNTFSQQVVSSNAEQELTSAIMYVTDPDPLQAVVFNSETAGTSYDNVMALLNANGIDTTEIDPLSQEIPEDADIIVINAPLNDYDDSIIDSIYSFLDNGGRLGRNLIYIADYSQKSMKNMETLLSEWGIGIGDGVVGDMDTANLQTQNYYIVRDYIKEGDYTLNVASFDLPVIDYQSRPLTLLFDNADTRSTVALLQTADTGFVFTEEMREAAERGENGDIDNGVQTTWALGRKYMFDENNQAHYSNVLVIGSSETLDESMTSTTYFNNGDYFISILNSMTGKNTGISLVAKDLTSETFDIDNSKVSTGFTVFVIVLPLVVLVIGVVVFIRRRTK
ncbi:MAG: Gldg family protein [Oscillospiraceae bacterium]|nr:Gldg family protein [Oscillospiraceae bacterium]